MIVQPAEGVIKCTSQLAGSALDGLVNGLRLMRDRNGLVPVSYTHLTLPTNREV